MDFIEDAWDAIVGGFEYIISFEWLEDMGEMFATGWEAFSNIEDSPLLNVWFWMFYVALMAGVWVLPSKFGVADYTFLEKIMYTFIFFIVDWFIVSHFENT